VPSAGTQKEQNNRTERQKKVGDVDGSSMTSCCSRAGFLWPRDGVDADPAQTGAHSSIFVQIGSE
jgi:hypothetical protein